MSLLLDLTTKRAGYTCERLCHTLSEQVEPAHLPNVVHFIPQGIEHARMMIG